MALARCAVALDKPSYRHALCHSLCHDARQCQRQYRVSLCTVSVDEVALQDEPDDSRYIKWLCYKEILW